MFSDRYLLDSNILIRWIKFDDPGAQIVETSLSILMARKAELHYTSQNLGEFWSVMTQPISRNGYGPSSEDANLRAREIEGAFSYLPDIPAIHSEWRRLLVKYRICGVQVHDARLVAAMQVHGVGRILTFNTKDFARFDSIEAVHPSQIS